jgi:hypothetical protein
MNLNQQIIDVWKYLVANNVNYLTIGGFRPKDLLHIEELEKLNRNSQ